MKPISIYLMFVILISILFCSATVFAQANLLPEKNTVSSENNSSESTQPTKNIDEQLMESSFFWSSITIILMIIGLFALFLEIAIIPGFGVAGITGIILLVVSLILAYWKLSRTLAISATVLAAIGVILLILYIVYVFPHSKLGRKFILEDNAPAAENVFEDSDVKRFVGAEGIAVSNLRPSGIVKIADERVDVITDGDFIEKGTKVKVIKTDGRRVIVSIAE